VLVGALLAGAGVRAQSAGGAEGGRRAGWQFMTPALQAMQNDLTQHPGQLWVAEGEALWSRPGANGRRCADCHAEVPPVAARYPRYPRANAGRPQTLAARVDACRVDHLGEAAEGGDGPAVLALQALIAQRSAGRPVEPDPALDGWAARGERLWRTRFGQLNLACAQCHDALAGQRLGGATIPQAHPTGYPVYRLEWQGVGSLARRLRGCLTGVRAEPFAAGADEWLALEAWLMRRAAGMPWEGVGVRP
jgi:sulfur-oxidizing protein SoxA